MKFAEKIKLRLNMRKHGVKVPIFRPLKPSEYMAIHGIYVREMMKNYIDKVAPIVYEVETENKNKRGSDGH